MAGATPFNNIAPSGSEEVSIAATPPVLRDSMTFDGRTPCNIPGIIEPGKSCYKLKWRIVLYADAPMNKPGRYKVLGTPGAREKGGKKGNWKIIAGKNGRVVYQLDDESGKGFLYLLKLDDNILVFTDAQGKLLVGDEDFSYTLNRK